MWGHGTSLGVNRISMVGIKRGRSAAEGRRRRETHNDLSGLALRRRRGPLMSRRAINLSVQRIPSMFSIDHESIGTYIHDSLKERLSE